MDFTKWNRDEAKIVAFIEGFEEGLEMARQKNRERACELDCEQAFEERLEKSRAGDSELINRAAARHVLKNVFSLKAINKITGLDLETIKRLQEDVNTEEK